MGLDDLRANFPLIAALPPTFAMAQVLREFAPFGRTPEKPATERAAEAGIEGGSIGAMAALGLAGAAVARKPRRAPPPVWGAPPAAPAAAPRVPGPPNPAGRDHRGSTRRSNPGGPRVSNPGNSAAVMDPQHPGLGGGGRPRRSRHSPPPAATGPPHPNPAAAVPLVVHGEYRGRVGLRNRTSSPAYMIRRGE